MISRIRNNIFTRGLRTKQKKPAKQLMVQDKVYRVITLNSIKTIAALDNFWFFCRSKPLFSLVLFPWLLFICYLFFIKSPIYESTAKVVIESSKADNSMLINIGFLGKGGGGGDNKNIYLTSEYISSREMMHYLDEKLNVLNHFRSKKIDWLSRLSSDARERKKLDYFIDKVGAVYDSVTNELTIHARSFNADYSYRLLKEILFQTKIFSNRVSNTLANERYVFAELQLKKARDKLYQSEKDVLHFQNKHKLFDPKETVKIISSVMSTLRSNLVTKQTELITYSSFMNNKASKIIKLKEEIAALKRQIQNQTSYLLGVDKQKKLNTILAEYQWLELNQTFAQAEYAASQKAYEMAKIDISQQQNLLIEISSPNLPDDYEYPHKLYDTVASLVCLLVFFVLFKMTHLIIQEHID